MHESKKSEEFFNVSMVYLCFYNLRYYPWSSFFSGLLYDKETGSYTMCFVLAGVVMVLGGFLGLPLQKLSNRQRRKYPERYSMRSYTVQLNDKSSNDVTSTKIEVPARRVNTNAPQGQTDA